VSAHGRRRGTADPSACDSELVGPEAERENSVAPLAAWQLGAPDRGAMVITSGSRERVGLWEAAPGIRSMAACVGGS